MLPAPPAEDETRSNRLRQKRAEAKLTRLQLLARCNALYKENPEQFVGISLSTLKRLEGAENRPRYRTATTLAVALSQSADDLFPNGYDDPNRNPVGVTRITENHRKKRDCTPSV